MCVNQIDVVSDTVNVTLYNIHGLVAVAGKAPKTVTPFKTYHRVCDKSSTTGGTWGSGTANHFEAPEVTPSFSEVRVIDLWVFFAMLCRSLFVLYSW
jgi:hypothetical protein